MKKPNPMTFTKIGRQAVNTVRFAEIVQVFVRHGFKDLIQRSGLHKGLPGRLLYGMRLVNVPVGEAATLGARLRNALTDLGPSFIKLGQVLSTRPDLVGHHIARELVALRDDVVPLPFSAMRPILEGELGGGMEDHFSEFDERPIASASLSQVYKARLHSGEEVAVKIQRPEIERLIESDISLLVTIAEWVHDYQKDKGVLDLPGIVEEFSRSIRRELNFQIEARVAEQFADNFEDEEKIVIPAVYREYSGRRVLTLQWMNGVPIDTLEAYEGRNSDPGEIARQGCNTLCKMIFEDRLFHADPHPGNIFLLEDNQIAFLDLGMAGHLEESDVQALLALFSAMFQGDAHQCVDAVQHLTSGTLPEDEESLAYEISDFIAFEAPVVINRGEVAQGLDLAVQIMRRHKLELAPRFSLLLKSLVTIETVGKSLDPDLDMLPIIRPHVERLFLARLKPRNILHEIQAHADGYIQLSRHAPVDLAHLLKQMRSGKLTFNIHHEHLENLANTIDRSSKRNAVAIVIASLVVGSSLLTAAGAAYARFGSVGFLVAGILGITLIISVVWKGNRS